MSTPFGSSTSSPLPRRRAAVVTASDRSAAGTREDRSGEAVAAMLLADGYEVVDREVVPDERGIIARLLARLADEDDLALIAVTGGTGFSPRDVTPEATRDVIDREAPGLAEAMRAAARGRTPTADLSRGVCGVRGTTLILNLPGSPRGATESLAAVLGILHHAIDQIAGAGDHETPDPGPAAAPAPMPAPMPVPTQQPAPAAAPPVGDRLGPTVGANGPEAGSFPLRADRPGRRRGGLLARLLPSTGVDAAQRALVLEGLAIAYREDSDRSAADAATPAKEPAAGEAVDPDGRAAGSEELGGADVDGRVRDGDPLAGEDATEPRRGLLGRVHDRLSGADALPLDPDAWSDDEDDEDDEVDEDDEDDEDGEGDDAPGGSDGPITGLQDGPDADPTGEPTRPRIVTFGRTDDTEDASTAFATSVAVPAAAPVAGHAVDRASDRRPAQDREENGRTPDGVTDDAADVAAGDATGEAAGEARDVPRRRSPFGRLAGTRLEWGAAAATVLLMLSMLALLTADQPPLTVGEVPLATVVPQDDPARAAVAAAPVGTATAVVTLAPPVTLRIPTITVDATIVSVGLEADGAMEIPSDVRTIGWYDPAGYPGVVPGTSGTAVLSGHVDSRSQGAGAFYYLRNLGLGDEIEVVHEDGAITRWIVTGRTQYAKDVIPLEELFVWEGAPRIALITCGGEFDRTARSYRDNIVVLAEPLGA
jgi:molybdopterin adenylyltransferase